MKINLNQIRKNYETYDKKREKIIKQGRVTLKSAKQLVYSVHKNNRSECETKKKDLIKDYKDLLKLTDGNGKLKYEGSVNEAAEEYAEGMLYFGYVFENKIYSTKDLNVSDDQYLGALSDLTGELGRKAVQLAIKKEFDSVYEIQEFVSNIYKEMMNFTFRNGSIRKKFDAIKWNLNKIEDILYDVEIKGKR